MVTDIAPYDRVRAVAIAEYLNRSALPAASPRDEDAGHLKAGAA
jgi:hypothetical protein